MFAICLSVLFHRVRVGNKYYDTFFHKRQMPFGLSSRRSVGALQSEDHDCQHHDLRFKLTAEGQGVIIV